MQYPVDDPDITTQTYSDDEVLPHDKMKFAATGCTLVDGTASITLSAQNSGLKLNLYGTNKTISKIVVTNTTSTETPKPTYTLNISGGQELSTSSFNPTPFFVVVPAGSYDFSITIFDNSATPASVCTYATTSAKTFDAGKILNMKARTVIKTGEFSVSQYLRVNFSPGNMYYDGSALKFEEHQYSYPTEWDPKHIGHFRWAHKSSDLSSDITSAIDIDTLLIGATKRWDIFFTNEDYEELRDEFEVGDETGKWRTLSNSEYDYLLGLNDGEIRSGYDAPDINGKKDCRFAYVKVDTICGLLIFPDTLIWPSSVTLPSQVNDTVANWNTATQYTLEKFALVENAGCAFLPATGYRIRKKVINQGGCAGEYWTSAASNNKDVATSFSFGKERISYTADNRYEGRSVRLVVDAQ